MTLYKQSPGEVNYVETVNQFADLLNGARDGGALTLFAPISAPGALSAAAAAGSGLGIGVYRYKVTFCTGFLKGDGSLHITGETEGGTTTEVTTTTGNQQVSLTSIPAGAAGTIARRIYRTAVSGADGTQKLAITIADNTTAAYTDTVADGSLGAAVPTSNTTGTYLRPPAPVNAGDAARKSDLDSKVAKSGDTMTGALIGNQAAPAGGQFAEYLKLQQGAADKFRWALDSTGNLVLQRWTGAAWSSVATFQVAGGVVLLNADQTDGIHLRNNSGLEWSTDGSTWSAAGISQSKVIAFAVAL